MEVQLRRLGPNSKIKILRTPKDCRTKIWLAGRGTSCQIYTKSKYASRQHFSITYREQQYFISDLQSANGTFLNDEKLTGEKLLTYGSIISVGVPSEMQNSPDCIVYIFELNTGIFSSENQTEIPKYIVHDGVEMKKNSVPKPALESITSAYAGPQQTLINVNNGLVSEPAPALKPTTNMDVDPQQTITNINEDLGIESAYESRVDFEKTTLNDNFSSEIMIIEPVELKKSASDSIEEEKPTKRRKLEENHIDVKEKENLEKEFKLEANNLNENNELDEDIIAYEAMTQVDEAQVKTEPDLLNYSLMEELIEISDSDDDWAPNLKQEGNKSPDGGDEDDDVVFLQRIIKEPRRSDLPPVVIKVEDDLTETDKKWMGKLLKIEKESDHSIQDEEIPEEVEDEKTNDSVEMILEEETNKIHDEGNVLPCADKLSRLSTHDEIPPATEEEIPRVEVPQITVKKVVPKKSVTFASAPEVFYFECPSRRRLTASEKGRLRFTKVIFNICNWNTHWLEECKRVAPDKDPPDICKEVLRKIPKKFCGHSDYMLSFLPVMLLHLWNKIKEKWVTTGESGFRQTLSCDSCDDYHAENLSLYKCTGLVQSVNAHKHLIREGNLVLLRLHQVPVSHGAAPASEKYSKKLGYLVFGFVESKSYERFQNQSLHRSLAERCASAVGDLHVVRLNILVKKRPSFQLDKQKLIQLTVVQQISQEIRMFRGICFLPDSPLCGAVLKPQKVDGTLVEPQNKNLIFKGPIDDVQSEIVRNLSYACSKTSSLLYGIHGAAGTGKGQVIIALILQMLFGDEWRGKKPKIIYCTQWSVPLDDMVIRLKNYSHSLHKPFSVVRVGPGRQVKPEVRDLCVSHLANNLRNKKGANGRKIDPETQVLKEADVICTTCISSGISIMCSAFEKVSLRDRDRKIVCIIDEAMSCRETESVIPLLLGVTHLILVGDIYQMEPEFSGEKTRALGLDMSLFWRIYKNVLNIPKELWPMYILKTQYRMESSLSKFISLLIYSTPLQKPASKVFNCISSIKSHLLLVDRTPEDVLIRENGNGDIRLVSQLVKTILRLAKEVTKSLLRFAVISCDSRQVENLQLVLPKTTYPEVEIDLIPAVQGREFDLVMFVNTGRKILNSWLATALTRAKSSLFVVASEQSIKENALLQKISEMAEKYGFLKYVHSDMTGKDLEDIVKKC